MLNFENGLILRDKEKFVKGLILRDRGSSLEALQYAWSIFFKLK